jgi:hypothetical protein
MFRTILALTAVLFGLNPAAAQADNATTPLFSPETLQLAELGNADPALGHRARGTPPRPKPVGGGAWFGIGTGVLHGTVEYDCVSGKCDEQGIINTYSANFTAAGPMAARVRATRSRRKDGEDANGNPRTAYETAALIGPRFGQSPWYGLIGVGRIRHADDNVPQKIEGFSWEILMAPRTAGNAGFELSFHGHNSRHLEFVGFSLGMRFGALR